MNMPKTETGWLSGDDLARFWTTVEKTSTCWLWRAGISSTGYGHFVAQKVNYSSHRVAYLTLVGAVPDGMVLDHICRVRHCVNPEHLRVVTPRENTLAGIGPSATNARKTHCKRQHELTPENVYTPPGKDERHCRECKRIRNLDFKRRNRERIIARRRESNWGRGFPGPTEATP